MRPRHHVTNVEHPESMMRFSADEWDGEPMEAFATWRRTFQTYWAGQAASGRVVLPVGTVRYSRETHLFWKLGVIGQARQIARST